MFKPLKHLEHLLGELTMACLWGMTTALLSTSRLVCLLSTHQQNQEPTSKLPTLVPTSLVLALGLATQLPRSATVSPATTETAARSRPAQNAIPHIRLARMMEQHAVSVLAKRDGPVKLVMFLQAAVRSIAKMEVLSTEPLRWLTVQSLAILWAAVAKTFTVGRLVSTVALHASMELLTRAA